MKSVAFESARINFTLVIKLVQEIISSFAPFFLILFFPSTTKFATTYA